MLLQVQVCMLSAVFFWLENGGLEQIIELGCDRLGEHAQAEHLLPFPAI